ncbi:MAG: hypothetical protein ACO2Y5_03935 [Nitrosopumilaceae archaeon]
MGDSRRKLAISGICKFKFPLIATVLVLGIVLVPIQAEALDFSKKQINVKSNNGL